MNAPQNCEENIIYHVFRFLSSPQINISGGGETECMSREWNTPIREPWNASIHQILKAIDNHRREWLATGDPWHDKKAIQLAEYLHELKTWIHKEEKENL